MVKNEELGKILVKQNYISEKDLEEALKFIKGRKSTLTDYLLRSNLITADLLGQAVAENYGVQYADLNSQVPPKEQVLRIPEEAAKKYRIVLFKEGDDGLIITTDQPEEALSKEAEIKQAVGYENIKFAYSLTEDIESIFVSYRRALETRFSKIIEEQKRVAPEIIDEIIADALLYRASDVHLEPQEKEVTIRFRIDGIMQEAGRIEKQYYENILNRIKVLAHLRTDEHNRTQDGAIRYPWEEQTIDLRVSVAPTLDGEKVVIRVLAEYVRSFILADLGLAQSDRDVIEAASKKPFGMILSTGPTGSGKTTTMYSILKLLNKPEVNIATIEDPVEYKIPGVNHIQVNEEADITFARGLRSIARQDPDIILVGEIRDEETAEIAVNAALTGHLLLSTFHANDAATTIPRLLDMGIEPFLLASTLELIVAQRLVRRLCENCRVSFSTSSNELTGYMGEPEKYFAKGKVTLYKVKGCARCNHTGYRGRIALYEVIRMTSDLQEFILKRPSAKAIWQVAKEQGARSLFDDGMEKVKAGVTTLEEVVRVVSPPQ